MTLSRSSGVVLAAAILATGVTGFATAQTATPAKRISACAKKKGGALRLAARCAKTERRVRWAAAGRAGAAGAAGPAGQDGAAGAVGPTGATGPAGAPGTAGVAGTPGTNGTDGASTGETLYAESLSVGSNFGTSCGAPSGPSTTFAAVTGTYVQIMAQVDLQRSTASADSVCLIVDGSSAGTILSSTSLSYETKALASTVVLPLAAGSHTISLAYTGTGGTANFRNRRLWVTVFHPAG